MACSPDGAKRNPGTPLPHSATLHAGYRSAAWRERMDFELPDELREFKQSLRRFVNTELIPVERDTLQDEELKPHYRERLVAGAKALGIWMMEVPEDYGGGGLSLLARTIVTEELCRSIALPARGEGITGPTVRSILYTLTGEMK